MAGTRPVRDHRQVLEGIIYRFRTGIAWRDLPAEFGPWQTVWQRHKRFRLNSIGRRNGGPRVLQVLGVHLGRRLPGVTLAWPVVEAILDLTQVSDVVDG